MELLLNGTVLVCNGKAFQFCKPHRRLGRAFVGNSKKMPFKPNEVYRFAEMAVDTLKNAASNEFNLLHFPYLRVDIMMYRGRMVVNEFESLEANTQRNMKFKSS